MTTTLFLSSILFTIIVGLLAVQGSSIRDSKVLLPHSYEASIKLVNRHFCNGAIISPRHVLTAAHCFYQNGKKFPETIYGYMSVVTGSNGDLSEGGKSHRIKSVTTHKDLSNAAKDFWISDIAVVTLDAEISFSSLEQPIELPDNDINENARAKTSIWNSPVESLQIVEIHLISHTKCAEKLREKFLGEHDSKICGYTRAGRGFCLNNSGSPLIQNGKVVGIASASDGCINGNPDVFINVYRNLDFINRATTQNEV